jgi:hypothetical protein
LSPKTIRETLAANVSGFKPGLRFQTWFKETLAANVSGFKPYPGQVSAPEQKPIHEKQLSLALAHRPGFQVIIMMEHPNNE